MAFFDLMSEPESFFEMPESDVKRIFWVLALPTSALLYLTVPDCRQKRWRSWFPVSFVLSVAYIGGMAYLLVWMVTIIGSYKEVLFLTSFRFVLHQLQVTLVHLYPRGT